MKSTFSLACFVAGVVVGGLLLDPTPARAACDKLCQAKCNYDSACIAKWSEINAKGPAYARQIEDEMRQANPALAQRNHELDCKYHSRYCQQ